MSSEHGLSDRPIVNGMVLPYIAGEPGLLPPLGLVEVGHADINPGREIACDRDKRCPVCGKSTLGIVAERPDAGGRHLAGNYPLHPECAAYTRIKCPAMNGSMNGGNAEEDYSDVEWIQVFVGE